MGVTPWPESCCRTVTTQTGWGLLTVDPIACCSRDHLLWTRDAGFRLRAPALLVFSLEGVLGGPCSVSHTCNSVPGAGMSDSQRVGRTLAP